MGRFINERNIYNYNLITFYFDLTRFIVGNDGKEIPIIEMLVGVENVSAADT